LDEVAAPPTTIFFTMMVPVALVVLANVLVIVQVLIVLDAIETLPLELQSPLNAAL
jgi:hypothetical protein